MGTIINKEIECNFAAAGIQAIINEYSRTGIYPEGGSKQWKY
ncbi:hypothetical protein [Bacillus sp. NEB1478]|nr:hypothetical protein [Bacillus sp. NEB1478]WNB90327.1 hypothetical protein RGB74_10360 [Bacillus sp. NEB1478]